MSNNACSPMFDNWDKLFPTINVLVDQIGVEMVHIIERFQQELRYLFWDAGEEVPYDEEAVFSMLLADFRKGADLYPAIIEIEERAKQIVYQAEMELSGIQDSSGKGNYVNIGFGLYGAIQAGVANLGASLLDRGIEQMATNSTIKKYQAQIEELRKGAQTIETFENIAYDFLATGGLYAARSIAEKNNVPCIDELRQPEWDKRKPSYAKLSTDDKIRECISELEFCPIHQGVFLELVELSGGKDDALIEYGNRFIGENVGTQARQQQGERAYRSAIQLPEGTLEDINAKITAIQDACELAKKDSSNDEKLARLQILQAKMNLKQEAKTRRSAILSRLEFTSWADLLLQQDIHRPDGWTTFVLESFLSQDGYCNLPDAAVIQRFAEQGNGTPQLIYTEATSKGNAEPVEVWTRWAKRGNPYALLRLGLCRLLGAGIEKDVVRSKQLICRAADNGYPPAIYILHQIAIGKYKPGFGYSTSEEKTKYGILLECSDLPEEEYLSFGRGH